MDKTDLNPTKVLVSVVLDRSGSMLGSRAGTISGYNEYLQGLRADKDTAYEVTLVQFDAPLTMPELTVSYKDRALADVPDLTTETYEPRGNTPLYDAIGECVRRTEAGERGVIILVITDGCENASREFTNDSIKALIKEKEAAGWTFAFLGADIDSYSVGGTIGMSYANTSNYVKGHEQTMYGNLASATVGRSAAMRSHGMVGASRMAFFTDAQKSAMEQPSTGGDPNAAGNFPVPAVTTTTVTTKPLARKRRDWKVDSSRTA